MGELGEFGDFGKNTKLGYSIGTWDSIQGSQQCSQQSSQQGNKQVEKNGSIKKVKSKKYNIKYF